MKKFGQRHGQGGSVALIIVVIVLSIAFIVSALLAYNFHGTSQDYKDNVDKKVSAAVQVALADQKTKLQSQFDDQSKSPVLQFKGPVAFGSISFNYPRTWNGYVDETDQTNPITGFFFDGIVPPAQSGAKFALRLELTSADYVSIITGFNDNITLGTLKSSAYLPPKMAKVTNAQTGIRFDGQIEIDAQNNPIQGSMVVLKIRDKTLKIYTESPSSLNDFNNTILPSLSYVP